VLRPTRALATQAARLAAGDLAVRSGGPHQGGNEIARLGHALDAMAGRLAADMQRLHTNEERYREVVEGAGDGIFTSDEQGIVLDVNARGCALTQRTRAEIVGRPLSDFVHPDEGPAAYEMIGRVLAGAPGVGEWRMRLPGDVYMPIEVNATRLPNGRLAVVPGASHTAPVEQAALVNDMILAFLDGPEKPAELMPLLPSRT